ncbi:restriction endonuclease subunit S [Massilia cavernae]|nr:restriction endonuclease subunit S [Massilia cavernae]
MNVKLDQIATVRTLTTFRDRTPVENVDGNAHLLSIRDVVTRWPPDLSSIPRVVVDEHQLSAALEEGDILLPGRGASYPARLFHGAPRPVCTAGQVYVIRAKREIDPAYLCWYLNRPVIQAEINQLLAGSSIKALNKSSLLTIEISLPPEPERLRIAELRSLSEQRTRLRDELERLDQAEIEHACETLFEHRRAHG